MKSQTFSLCLLPLFAIRDVVGAFINLPSREHWSMPVGAVVTHETSQRRVKTFRWADWSSRWTRRLAVSSAKT